MNYDIVIASIPQLSPEIIPYAPSFLKQNLENNGIKCKVVDWNKDFYSDFSSITPDYLFTQFSFSYGKWDQEKLSNEKIKYLNKHYTKWSNQLKSLNSKWFGLSIYSKDNVYVAIDLLKIVRKINPNIKIIVGGKGLYLNSSVFGNEYNISVGKWFKEIGLTDHYILGDGEESLIHLLNGDLSFSGIDENPSIQTNFNIIPSPNYSDLNYSDYKKYLINTCRGCPNNCNFCNSKIFYNKLRYRNSDNVIEEILNNKEKYNMKEFYFGDFVFNSNIHQLRKIADGIKEKKIKWTGQMIYNSSITNEDYKLLSVAGFSRGYFGLESGSEQIRNDMGKVFSNESVLEMLKLMSKYKILIELMIMVGYPTETETEFQKTLDFITRLKDERINGIIIGLMPPCFILEESKLQSLYDFTFDKNGQWIYKDNDMVSRLNRWKRLQNLCLNLKIDTHIKWEKQIGIQMNKFIKKGN